MPRCGSRREAVRVARRVAAGQADLVRALAGELDVEVGVDLEVAVAVELDHPAVDALRVELAVPRRVQRVRQVDALAVAAYLDHLRAPRQLARRRARRAGGEVVEGVPAGSLWVPP